MQFSIVETNQKDMSYHLARCGPTVSCLAKRCFLVSMSWCYFWWRLKETSE